MTKFSLKRSHYSLNTHFEWEKLSIDDFLMTTWEREVDSQGKKKPQIPHHSLHSAGLPFQKNRKHFHFKWRWNCSNCMSNNYCVEGEYKSLYSWVTWSMASTFWSMLLCSIKGIVGLPLSLLSTFMHFVYFVSCLHTVVIWGHPV